MDKRIVLAVISVYLVSCLVEADVQCGNNKFCRVGFEPFKSRSPNEFRDLREIAEKLIELNKLKIIGVHNARDLFELISYQKDLCSDDTIGFLLDKNISDYQVSCLWTGALQFGKCRAVPPKYSKYPYYYIKGEIWKEKVTSVHQAIGCRNNGVEETIQLISERENHQKGSKNITGVRHRYQIQEPSELYICNDRCVQGGIGYLASIVIILGLAFSFFKNCVVDA